MEPVTEGSLLWEPSTTTVEQAQLTHYMNWLADNRNLSFQSYPELWRWSVDQIEDFWASLWDYFALKASKPATQILGNRAMPGAEWFVGMELNWAENIFARMSDERPMLLYKAEDQPLVEISWQEVYQRANRMAQVLREAGIKPGDRVVAYMPNIPETIVAVLATTSLGAIWSSCSPDFGTRSVLDRFTQIEPRVLIAVNGYNYGGKCFDRCNVVAELQSALPTLEQTILVPHADCATNGLVNTVLWDDALNGVTPPSHMIFEQVSFSHPLWVLYSSGTTGLPKPIVHGHGGILLEHSKSLILHNDLKPSDHFFWYSSTGWMMWNYILGSLLSGCTAVIYNGSPGYPDMNALFQLAHEAGITYFGTSAAFISACINAEITPNQEFDLSKMRAVGSTGSPLTVSGFQWIYENINETLALESLSGGTDLCTAFVGGSRIMPIYAGEIQGASLGANVQSFNEAGEAILDEVGELVITEPMPSMPLFFWNDPDNRRYLESYFEMYPGVWRHGDWIKFNERGGCVIYGRSDSTINRQGVRMGTSEIYQAVESLPEILDSLIIDLEALGRESYMPLFVVLRHGADLNEGLLERLKTKLRQDVSPRHVPDEVFVIDKVPYTLSGKKMEVPIRKILLGQDVNKAVNPGAMRNPESIDYFIEFARGLKNYNTEE
ncbi:acetoacetate--CoA ligase [Chloroflexi bacterium TSY]|nr:acetoacetate--CoA ligase [Chloroflexi bacterium TSY]